MNSKLTILGLGLASIFGSCCAPQPSGSNASEPVAELVGSVVHGGIEVEFRINGVYFLPNNAVDLQVQQVGQNDNPEFIKTLAARLEAFSKTPK